MRLLTALLVVVYVSKGCGVHKKRNGRSGGLFVGSRRSTVLPSRHAVNSTIEPLNVSLYCDNTAELLGYWKYGSNESSDAGVCWKDEGITWENREAVERQIDKYSCSAYQSATFITPNCSILPTLESLNILKYNLRAGSFVYVGDSLMMQQYIAAKCDVHHSRLGSRDDSFVKSFNVKFVWDQYLRPNIPCQMKCLQNATFRLAVRKQFPDPCSGCPNGKLISSTPPHHSSFMKMKIFDEKNITTSKFETLWWMHRLPADTRLVIIGTGAWYNKFQGIDNGSDEYKKTLMILKSIFRHLIDIGIVVVWLALPAMVDDINYKQKKGKYGWEEFMDDNHHAFQSFKALGVIYVDLQLAMLERKLHDPSISPDGLHWCNIGTSSMPSFINQVIFHQVALSKEMIPLSKRFINPHRSGLNKAMTKAGLL